jgi:hypothetical protein
MDPCERDVITAHKLHLLSQEEMRERKKKTGFMFVLQRKKDNFTPFLDISKMAAK